MISAEMGWMDVKMEKLDIIQTNMSPEKWCLEDYFYFPFWNGSFLGGYVSLVGGFNQRIWKMTRQIGSSPIGFGVNIKNNWNHHQVIHTSAPTLLWWWPDYIETVFEIFFGGSKPSKEDFTASVEN